MLPHLQVIFKKFQIPCPFEEFSVNGTASHLSLNDSVHIHEYNNGVVHEDDNSHCTPRMFTINPQVGGWDEEPFVSVDLYRFWILKARDAEML